MTAPSNVHTTGPAALRPSAPSLRGVCDGVGAPLLKDAVPLLPILLGPTDPAVAVLTTVLLPLADDDEFEDDDGSEVVMVEVVVLVMAPVVDSSVPVAPLELAPSEAEADALAAEAAAAAWLDIDAEADALLCADAEARAEADEPLSADAVADEPPAAGTEADEPPAADTEDVAAAGISPLLDWLASCALAGAGGIVLPDRLLGGETECIPLTAAVVDDRCAVQEPLELLKPLAEAGPLAVVSWNC